MKPNNKLISTFILFAIFLFSFFKFEGFKNPIKDMMEEIEEKIFINVTAIDVTDSGRPRVTVSFTDFSAQDNQKGGGSKNENKSNTVLISTEGSTIFDAHRKLHLLSPKTLNYGHIKWLLYSEKVARSTNFADDLDFELRDFERGWSGNIAIVKGSTAEKFMLAGSDEDEPIEKQISGIQSKANNLSITGNITFYEMLDYLNQKDSSFCIPYFVKNPAMNKDASGIPLLAGGLAIIKDKKLYDFLDKDVSRGVNWITGKVGSTSIVVKCPHESLCSFEVLRSNSQIKTSFKEGVPEAEIIINVISQINELPTEKEDPIDKIKDYLKKKQEVYVKTEASAALAYCQKNNADVLGIGDSFAHQHPLKWKAFEAKWKKLFPKMKVTIKVNSVLIRSGLFTDYMIKEKDTKK